MYCPFCGRETPNGAKFCTQCGEKLPSIKIKPEGTHAKSERRTLFKNKKAVISIVSVLVAIALVVVLCISVFHSPANAVVDEWYCVRETNYKLTFTKSGLRSGEFQLHFADFLSMKGEYTIDYNNTLEMIFSWGSAETKTEIFKYGPEAKIDDRYWYISDGSLYLGGDEYRPRID